MTEEYNENEYEEEEYHVEEEEEESESKIREIYEMLRHSLNQTDDEVKRLAVRSNRSSSK